MLICMKIKTNILSLFRQDTFSNKIHKNLQNVTKLIVLHLARWGQLKGRRRYRDWWLSGRASGGFFIEFSLFICLISSSHNTTIIIISIKEMGFILVKKIVLWLTFVKRKMVLILKKHHEALTYFFRKYKFIIYISIFLKWIVIFK